MRVVELPEALSGRPFTVAEGRAAGMRGGDLRRARIHAPTRSVRTASRPATLRATAEAFTVGMPCDVAFSHVTAALLLGLPLPASLEGQAFLDVMRPTSVAQVRRRGCRGHRGLERRDVIDLDGLRVVGPADTWVDLGEVAGRGLDVDDLIVVGDVVAGRLHLDALTGADPFEHSGVRPEHALAALGRMLDRRTRPRGKALLQQAFPLIRVGSRSPMETRARLMFHRARFPEPELNGVVRDAYGGWLLEGDLLWRKQRVIGEYQGADHASIKRRSADASRATGAEAEGYRILEIYAEDVYRGARRRACLTRFARAMSIDPADLWIE
jgi:hypothetical protein